MSSKEQRTLEDYLALPYTDWIRIDAEEGGFIAGVEELPGCLADGETRAEAIERLQDAKRAWIGAALEFGDPIPQPLALEGYSGRMLVRAPKSLHRDLAHRAALEGVSLNQVCVSYLSRALGLTGVASAIEDERVSSPAPVGRSVGSTSQDATARRHPTSASA